MTSLPEVAGRQLVCSAGFDFDYTAAPRDLARLDCNEYFQGPDQEEQESLARAFDRAVLHRYPDVRAWPLREAFARYLDVSPDEVLVANGSVETIGLLVEAFCTGRTRRHDGSTYLPGKVLFPEPTFPLFRLIAHYHGAPSIGVPLRPDFSIDEGAFLHALDHERPALSFVPSPNNPTGNRFDSGVLARLIDRAQGVFVVDEAYAEFDGQSLVHTARETPGLFVMRSLSKVGFAGLRLGALIGHRDGIARLDEVRIPWNVDAVAIVLGCTVLERPGKLRARIASVIQAREELRAALAHLPGITVYPSHANFLLVRVNTKAAEITRRLLERHVLVRDVSAPGLLSDCLRISVGSPGDNERCVRALRDVLTLP